MKTIITTFALLLFVQFISTAQCSRGGDFIAITDPVKYPISGTAKFEFQQNGTKQVIFENNFETVQGAVLQTFLSIDENFQLGTDLQISTRELYVNEDDNIKGDFGDAISGMRIFNVPNEVTFDEYNYIMVYCTSAKELWGSAALGLPTGAGCSTLAVSTFTNQELSISPNPAHDILNIQLKALNTATIKIFDMKGQLVQNSPKIDVPNSKIDVSSLNSGLYLLEISSNNKKGYQQLVIGNL